MAAASHEFRQKHPKNRKNKFKLVFDEENRAEFLSGFHKRKEERRKKARDDAERKLKEAKRKEREERRKILKQKLHRYQNSASFHALDGLLNPEPTMYDHPEHTVTVTTITDVNLDENFIGPNEVDYVKDEVKNGDEAETKHKKSKLTQMSKKKKRIRFMQLKKINKNKSKKKGQAGRERKKKKKK